MPEIPDLEAYATYFNRRLPGLTVVEAAAPIPWIIRANRDEFLERIKGQVFKAIHRYAKMLFFPFESGENLVVHAMLAGRYQYVEPGTKFHAKTSWILKLDNGMDLRYFDERLMGRTFLAREDEFAEKLPRWTEMGPDVLDPALTEEAFVKRLSKNTGMIKNIITNERVIAGIGNAYSDEILWEARLHPFRKRTDIPPEGVAEIYRSIHRVMEWSTPIVAQRMEEEGLPAKMYRDHLRVHARKEDAVCPRDGHRITSITSGGRETNFCRACQL